MSWRGYSFKDRSESMGVSLAGEWGTNASRVTRVYDVTLTDYAPLGAFSHQTLVRLLLGWPELAGTDANPYIRRTTPHYLNYRRPSDNRPFLYAVKASTKGIGPLSKENNSTEAMTPTYDTLRLTVEYSTLPFQIKEDNEITQTNSVPDESLLERYVTLIARPGGQFFSINGASQYKFVDGLRTPVLTGISKWRAHCDLQITWHQVPEICVPSLFVNPSVIAAAPVEKGLGAVNNAAWNGYAKGTLLLVGAQMKPDISPFGDRIFDITYFMKFAATNTTGITSGWQYSLFPTGATWYEVTTDGNSNLVNQTVDKSIFNWIDFNTLFRPPT